MRYGSKRCASKGERAARARTIDVFDPYTNTRIGTVPMASVDDVRDAFEYAANYRSKLTRYERSQILERAAALLRERTEEASDLISLESGLSKQDSRYEIGRVADVFKFAAIEALRDDGQSFSCDLTPHGKERRVFSQREPLARRDRRDHAVQSSDEPGRAQDRAGYRDEQSRGAEAVGEGAAVGAVISPTFCTKPVCRADAAGADRRSARDRR